MQPKRSHNVAQLIARRYIRPRRFSFIAIIGITSVVGIVIGTAALIIVLSLFNGFRAVAQDAMIGFGPHVRITPNSAQFQPPTIAFQRANNMFVYPVLEQNMVMQYKGSTAVIHTVGLQPQHAIQLTGLQKSVVVGKFSLSSVQDIVPVVIAVGIAEKMRVYVGDTVALLSPKQIERAITLGVMPSGTVAIVTGIFQSNSARNIDESYAYVHADVMQQLTKRIQPTAYEVLLENVGSVEASSELLQQECGATASIETWYQMNKGLYDTMKLERLGSFIVLTLIVVVAAFNVLVSLTLTVVEKQRDIAILQTMGFLPSDIRAVYIWLGLYIGVGSVSIGATIGAGLSVLQEHFHILTFANPEMMLVPAVPFEVHLSDVLLTMLVCLILATGAAIYPAYRATRISPAQAIR